MQASKMLRFAGFLFGLFALAILAGCDSAEERTQSYYQSGLDLMAKGDPVKAGLEFRNALKLNNEFVPALFSLAQAEQQQGNLDRAGQFFFKVIELDPKHVEARTSLANLFLLGGNLENALKYADEAYALAPKDTHVLVVKAAVSLKMDNRGDAVRFANAALETDAKDIDALMVLAAERLLASQPAEALSYLNKVSADADSNMGLQLFKMKVLDALGDKQGIEQVFEKLIAKYPKQPNLHYSFARWYTANGRAADAERVMRQFASANPTDTQAALSVVSFVSEQKGDAAAEAELKSMIDKGAMPSSTGLPLRS